MGKVYLVGAGPGSLDLLTVKALRLIKQADVLIYDRLINPDILDYAKDECEAIYAGKEDGMHLLPQEEINRLLSTYAEKFPMVVRLKGGDPFVFGRGGEEALHLAEKKIPFEIVPGISSSISAAAYAGIPVTQRGVASSFAVITGHMKVNSENPPNRWKAYSEIDTLVFLMGVKNRQQIAEGLIEAGRSPQETVAFIERGTTDFQKVYHTTLEKISQGQPEEISSPAIMVVGKVVELGPKLNWFNQAMEAQSK